MIPPFNASGVLPPYVGGSPVDPALQAPYSASMLEVVQRFAISEERREILHGLIRYRATLRASGFIEGSQWLDGSFVENVELTRGRPPGDVDVVTVAYRPNRMSDEAFEAFVDENFHLFDQDQIKQNFMVDGYFIDLNSEPHLVASDATYWSNLFSHQRVTSLWKGMLSVPLNCDDVAAEQYLLEDANHA